MMPEALSPYQTNVAGTPRKSLEPEKVAYAIDEVNARRVRLMQRLSEVILEPTAEDEEKRSKRCEAQYSDHIIVQALMMTAKHCRDLDGETEPAAKTAALQALCKVTLEAVKEGNAASQELQRIKEHNDRMRMEMLKMESKGKSAIPTLQETIARLNGKEEDDA